MRLKSMKRWEQALVFGLAWPILALLARLPAPWTVRLGRILGLAAYHLDRRHRRVALQNLELAFPDMAIRDREALALRSFQNVVTTFLEVPRLGRAPFDEILSRVRPEGAEHFLSALEEGKGVLILTGHFGNWELMALYTGMRGLRVAFVARALDNRFFDRWMTRIRSRCGNRVIPKRGALLQVLRLLRRGWAVGFLMDQRVTGREGVFVDFFSRPAGSSAALALLACRYGAPVLPVYVLRDPSGVGHRLCVEPKISVVRTGDLARDIVENTKRFQNVLERIIRQHPDQWFWLHRRWRGSPGVFYDERPKKRRR